MDRRKQHISPLAPVWVFSPAGRITGHPQPVGNWFEQRRTAISGSSAVRIILTLGFAGTLTGLVGVGSQAYQEQLQPVLGKGVLSNKMAGWNPFSERTRQVLRSEFLINALC